MSPQQRNGSCCSFCIHHSAAAAAAVAPISRATGEQTMQILVLDLPVASHQRHSCAVSLCHSSTVYGSDSPSFVHSPPHGDSFVELCAAELKSIQCLLGLDVTMNGFIHQSSLLRSSAHQFQFRDQACK